MSAYTFSPSSSTTGGSSGGTIVRVTFDVPDDISMLYYDTSGGDVRGGFLPTQGGYAVIDLAEAAAPGESLPATDVTFRAAQDGPALWQGTVTADVMKPARPTELTVIAPPTTAKAGSSIVVSGTLTKDGTPIVGHWIQLGDQRQQKCTDAVGYCASDYRSLGQAQVDASGHWEARIPLRWTSHLVASYCNYAASCWYNANTPAFATLGTVTTKWAPTAKVPTKVRKGRPASYSVSLPAAVRGVPVKLQAWLDRKWKTVASTKIAASQTVSLSARLPVTGKVKVRAYVPGYSYFFPGQSAAYVARKVYAGQSATRTVRVTR